MDRFHVTDARRSGGGPYSGARTTEASALPSLNALERPDPAVVRAKAAGAKGIPRKQACRPTIKRRRRGAMVANKLLYREARGHGHRKDL